MLREKTTGGKIDFVLICLYASLVGIGWVMIYAVGYKQGYTMSWSEFMLKTPAGKQAIFMGVAVVLFLLVFSIATKFWRVFAYGVYSIGIVLLILVLIFGKEINGAKAWFSIAGFGFQPAEIAKLGTALSLSTYLATPSVNIRENKTLLIVLGLIAAPMALIILQPDAGSMLIFLSFSLMLFREGLSPLPYLITLAVGSVFISALIFQPNELVSYLLMLASVIFAFNINNQKRWWIIGTSAGIGAAIFLQIKGYPNTALIIMAIMGLAYLGIHSFRGRFKLVISVGLGLLIAIGITYATSFVFNNVLKKHQQERINVWLRPDKCDPRGAAYNLNNSKMAIGSGGLQGKGFLEGTMTQMSFVPEQETDFIFCTIGEEQGFLGVVAIVTIFVLFILRIIQIGERHRSKFVRLYAYCLVGIFFFHFFINIGMTMGLLPVIGIPLPFISAGGSSLLSFTTMLAILMRLDSDRFTV